MPMKVRPLPESSEKRRTVSRKLALPASMMMSCSDEHRAQQRDLLVDRLAGLHQHDDRARRPDRRGELGDAVARHDAIPERAGAFDECVGARRRAVEDGDAMALFGDVEREVRAHHAKADQADVGSFPSCSPYLCWPCLVGWSRSSPCGRGRCLTAAGAFVNRGVRQCLAPAAVELQPVVHDVVAELARDLVLQLLDAVGLELDRRRRSRCRSDGRDARRWRSRSATGRPRRRGGGSRRILPAASSSGRPSTATWSGRWRRRGDRSPSRRDGPPSPRADR